LRYDTEAAAEEGMQAMARGVLRDKTDVSRETAVKVAKKGQLCRLRSDAGPFAALRSGKDIALVGGPYERPASGSPRSAGTCAGALKWAKAVAAQR
jgi:hypothetical protein